MPFRFFSSLLFFALAVSAYSDGSVSLSVEEAASYALKHNATLAAARLRIEEARGRLQQSGHLANPELELAFNRNMTGREGSLGIAFMQRFPVTARLRYEKEVSRAELAVAEAEVRDGERKVAAEVRVAAVKLLALEAQRTLRSTQLSNSRDLAGFLLKRVEVGEASMVEASQVELETQQIEIENLQLAREEVALAGELRPQLGLSGNATLKITGELSSPMALPVANGIIHRPDIKAAEARAKAAAAAVLQQRASRWEDVGLGAEYSRERIKDEPDPVETEHIVGVKISIPLPIWNNNSGRIRETKAAAIRAEKEVDAVKLTADGETIGARAEMAALTKLITELDATVLPKAAQIEDLFRNNYSNGLAPLTDVLRARTRRLELQRMRIDALRDYQLARVRYSAAATTTTAAAAASVIPIARKEKEGGNKK